MPTLYTKNGKPLQRSGNNLYSRSGKHVGRIHGRKVFTPDGKYAGTIDGNRVAYRSTDSAVISSPFTPTAHAGTGHANAAPSGVLGDEPPFPD